MLEHFARDQLGCSGARYQDRADNGIGNADFMIDGVQRRIAGAHTTVKQFVNFTQARDRTIDHGDIST